jgi:crotonobetainyl-CoA:carnitine CoA-transferase CaiB-like acyl-CoA transferase
MLADLGARVIKVETTAGDPYRHLFPHGLLAAKTNAGKQSICLDLKSSDGRAIAEDLVRRADVLVHNFRPGVPEKLGIGYEQARALRPDLVWVCATGYGPDGPSARRPMTHPVAGAAMGGAGRQAGAALSRSCDSLAEIREGARQLMRANESNPDPNTSCVIAAASLLGLLARERFGIGQAIHVDMLLANAYANADELVDYPGKPEPLRVDDALRGLGPTYRLYPTREGWVFVALTSDSEWQRFCALIERAEFGEDVRFSSAGARGENADALAEELSAIFSERTAEDWERAALAGHVAIVRADATDPGVFFATDEHSELNGFVPTARHARFGELKRWGPLVTVNGGLDRYAAGALAGDSTDTLLRELGREEHEIARLRREGVVASEAVDPLA